MAEHWPLALVTVLHSVGVGLAGTGQALLERDFVPGEELVQNPDHDGIGQDRTRTKVEIRQGSQDLAQANTNGNRYKQEKWQTPIHPSSKETLHKCTKLYKKS